MTPISRIAFYVCMLWTSSTMAGDNLDLNSLVTDETRDSRKSTYEAIDKKLNEQYKILMTSSEFAHKDLLKDGERAWIAFRDTQCKKTGDGVTIPLSGALFDLAVVRCKTTLTASRVMELVYIQTGAYTDNFYQFLSGMSDVFPKKSDEMIDILDDEVKNASPHAIAYFRKNCELTALLYNEEKRLCNARISFQNRH